MLRSCHWSKSAKPHPNERISLPVFVAAEAAGEIVIVFPVDGHAMISAAPSAPLPSGDQT
jgi:hypothetical protein